MHTRAAATVSLTGCSPSPRALQRRSADTLTASPPHPVLAPLPPPTPQLYNVTDVVKAARLHWNNDVARLNSHQTTPRNARVPAPGPSPELQQVSRLCRPPSSHESLSVGDEA
jgi:hypothetical protein